VVGGKLLYKVKTMTELASDECVYRTKGSKSAGKHSETIER